MPHRAPRLTFGSRSPLMVRSRLAKSSPCSTWKVYSVRRLNTPSITLASVCTVCGAGYSQAKMPYLLPWSMARPSSARVQNNQR